MPTALTILRTWQVAVVTVKAAAGEMLRLLASVIASFAAEDSSLVCCGYFGWPRG
jgi:hypothetical protein